MSAVEKKPQTLPQWLLHNAATRPNEVAQRHRIIHGRVSFARGDVPRGIALYREGAEYEPLGGHPKPASSGHPKTGQLM